MLAFTQPTSRRFGARSSLMRDNLLWYHARKVINDFLESDMATALRPLSTGELLDRAFSLYRSHFVLFIGIFALPHLCVLAFQYLAFAFQTPKADVRNVLVTAAFAIVAGLLILFVTAASQAATVVAVSQVHLDRPASVSDSFSRVKGQIVGVIGLSLRVGFFVGLWALLLIVPGILKAIEWSLAIPAKVLEGKSASEAMARSSELSHGSRGRIFVIWFLFMVLSIAGSMLLQWPIQMASGASARVGTPGQNVAVVWQVASLVAAFLSQCLVGPLATIAFSLVYYDERVRKEAFDLHLMMTTLDAPGLEGAPA